MNVCLYVQIFKNSGPFFLAVVFILILSFVKYENKIVNFKAFIQNVLRKIKSCLWVKLSGLLSTSLAHYNNLLDLNPVSYCIRKFNIKWH